MEGSEVRELRITAYLTLDLRGARGERLMKRRMKANLVLGNLHKLLAVFFAKDFEVGPLPTDGVYLSFVDAGGTMRPGNRLRAIDNHSLYSTTNHNWSNQTFDLRGLANVRIYIGRGSTPPTVNDYVLENPIASAAPAARGVAVMSDGRFRVSYSAAFSFTAATDVSEAGLAFAFRGWSETAGAWTDKMVLLLRDTFATISCPAGSTLAVEYSFLV